VRTVARSTSHVRGRGLASGFASSAGSSGRHRGDFATRRCRARVDRRVVRMSSMVLCREGYQSGTSPRSSR
jgi:hypothetical protein